MSDYCEVFRVCCHANKKPSPTGNAFLYKDRLITVQHLVRKAYSAESTIQVKQNDSGELVECEVIAYDGDSFTESTLVVLRPKEHLNINQVADDGGGRSDAEPFRKALQGYTNWSAAQATDITCDVKQIPNAKEKRVEKTGERYNRQVDLQTPKSNYKGLSGSPIYNARGELCGIFNAQQAENSRAICGFGFCDGPFWGAMEKIRAIADQKEKAEAQQKASQPLCTFAEYVADACDDCPDGLRVLYDLDEYKRNYPNYNEKNSDEEIEAQKKTLEHFMYAINEASRCIDRDSAKKKRNDALKVLCKLYGDSVDMLNVYIAALYQAHLYAYINRIKRPKLLEKEKFLLDIAAEEVDEKDLAKILPKGFPKDFPHRHLFLAEYYLVTRDGLDQKAQKAMEEAGHLCKAPHCYSGACSLSVCDWISETALDNPAAVTQENFEYNLRRCLSQAKDYTKAASEMNQEVKNEIDKAKDLCELETNCYADILLISTCVWTAEGKEVDVGKTVVNLGNAIINRPGKYESGLSNTGAYRMQANYNAYIGQFSDALSLVKKAFEYDSQANTEQGCRDDDACFKHIYLKALHHFGQQGFDDYSKWIKFRTTVGNSSLYKRSDRTVLEEEENKIWRSALETWNINGRKPGLVSTEVLEYVHSVDTIDTDAMKALVQQCGDKALFLKVTEMDVQNPHLVQEKLENFQKGFSNMLGTDGTHCDMDGNAYLYIYEYKILEDKTLPIWHLICMK